MQTISDMSSFRKEVSSESHIRVVFLVGIRANPRNNIYIFT